MIVVQIIKSLAGYPSKMKAHLFSKVYNLVVNVSFGPKHPRLGFCLERITALLEKNGLRVVLPHPSTQGMERFKLACSGFPSGGRAEPEMRKQGALGPGLAAPAPKSWSTCEMDRFTPGPHSCLFLYLLMEVEDH